MNVFCLLFKKFYAMRACAEFLREAIISSKLNKKVSMPKTECSKTSRNIHAKWLSFIRITCLNNLERNFLAFYIQTLSCILITNSALQLISSQYTRKKYLIHRLWMMESEGKKDRSISLEDFYWAHEKALFWCTSVLILLLYGLVSTNKQTDWLKFFFLSQWITQTERAYI